jgi:hypothetical protein
MLAMNLYKFQFKDFNVTGGISEFTDSVKAENALYAEKILLAKYSSAWDVELVCKDLAENMHFNAATRLRI